MNNLNVSLILSEIADLLKIKDANQYKIQAYQRASKIVAELSSDIEDYWAQKELTNIEGIGDGIASKIEEILATGTCAYYQELIADYPVSLTSLLAVRGVGPSKVRKFYNQLGITNLEQLDKKANTGELVQISGVGSKTTNKILTSTQKLLSSQEKMDLGAASRLATKLVTYLTGLQMVSRIQQVGSMRRKEEIVSNISYVIQAIKPESVSSKVAELPLVANIKEKTDQKLIVKTKLGLTVTLFFTSQKQFSRDVFWLTGSKEFNTQLKKSISPLDNREEFETEKDIFRAINLPYIIPELRDQTDSIAAAQKDKLPASITLEDIQGDLHLHSQWSDGNYSIADMARACQEKGYQYLAITDHTQALTVANGLDYNRLQEQWATIDRVNDELEIEILKGAEVDILADELDYRDHILAELDIVIASIHHQFDSSQQEMMQRLFIALEHPEVDILGHPTGRLVMGRSAYNINFEQLVTKAVATNTILEINSAPQRLDLGAQQVKIAQQLGANFVINTDAHRTKQLTNLEYGVDLARKGWLEAEDVINTLELEELKEVLKY
ncbi:DNA polymerase/3'-5' exonuclease PolX [Halanaerobaculum tunisiense]